MVGTAFQADPIRSQLAFANQARALLNVEIERKRIRDLRGVAHGPPKKGNHAPFSTSSGAALTWRFRGNCGSGGRSGHRGAAPDPGTRRCTSVREASGGVLHIGRGRAGNPYQQRRKLLRLLDRSAATCPASWMKDARHLLFPVACVDGISLPMSKSSQMQTKIM